MTNSNKLDTADRNARDYILCLAREYGVYFGDSKVLLGSFGVDWSIPAHKRTLLALQREGLLRLARADLGCAMDPALVAASEVVDAGRYLTSEYHFVDISWQP